ncbi:MAG: GNAT family N-acetyltransferase [Peredibacter sp.]|nr:GNAT family N-acetyltransferase [Peredibacter sp.]
MSYHTRNLYMKPTTIKTDSVILRNFTDADGHNIKELDSDPEVMRYLTDGEPSSEEIVQKTMDVFLGFVDKTQGKYGFWAAEDIKTKEFIGWFQLRPLKEDPDNYKVLELGYRLKKKFWGKGIGTEVSKLLVKRAFDELNAKEVWAIAHRSNNSSTNIMKKCGLTFQFEKEYAPYPGKDKSCVYYRISKQEFEALNE